MEGSGFSCRIAKDKRLDVRLLKYELHNVLQKKGKHCWVTYWTSLQKYIVAELSSGELHEIIRDLLNVEDLPLHNAFIAALLHNANTKYLPLDYKKYAPLPTTPSPDPKPPRLLSNERPVLGKVPSTTASVAEITSTSTPSNKRKRSFVRSNPFVESNQQAMRRLLEITRSKVIRSRCKVSEQQAAASMSLLTRSSSKRYHQTPSKSNYVPTFAVRSSKPPSIQSELDKAYIYEPQSKAYVRQRPPQDLKARSREYEVQEEGISNHSILQELQAKAIKSKLGGATPDAAKALTTAVETYLTDLIYAAIESMCDEQLIPLTSLTLKSKRSGSILTRAQQQRPPGQWYWAHGLDSTSKGGLSMQLASSRSTPTPKGAKGKSTPSKKLNLTTRTTNPTYTILPQHLLEATETYPVLVARAKAYSLERISAAIEN